MAIARKPITLVGCGPGGGDHLTPASREAASQAQVLLGDARLLGLFPEATGERIELTEIPACLKILAERVERGQKIAVLVSGDPGLYSLSRLVFQRFGREACEVIPGLSSIQVAFARAGVPWEDALILSAHARIPDVNIAEARERSAVAILLGNEKGWRWARQLAVQCRESHTAILCQDLTLPEERVEELDLDGLDQTVSSRSILLLVKRSAER